MDYPQECICGRSFTQVNAINNHRRTCKKSKSRLASALTSAQENWRRKRARLNMSNEGTIAEPLPSTGDTPGLEEKVSYSLKMPDH